MGIFNTTQTYGSVAKFFHWVMFVLTVLAMVVGLRMDGMEGQDKEAMEAMHRSWGLVILSLLVLRFCWKLLNPRPASPPGTALMNLASSVIHWLFYALILLQAVAGIFMSQASGVPVTLFGLLGVPPLVDPSAATAELWEEIHEVNWIVLAVLVVIHTLAALAHHFVARDDVLRRMWFSSR